MYPTPREAGQVATAEGQFAEFKFGRCVLIGVPKSVDRAGVLEPCKNRKTRHQLLRLRKRSGSQSSDIGVGDIRNGGEPPALGLEKRLRRRDTPPRSGTPSRVARRCALPERARDVTAAR